MRPKKTWKELTKDMDPERVAKVKKFLRKTRRARAVVAARKAKSGWKI
jgi:hypothetical protein